MKLLISAVEPSADALGAALVDALRARCDDLEIIGCGGPLLAARGLESLFDIAPFSVIGPSAALRALPAAINAANKLTEAAAQSTPDAAIFIDSWSFSRLAAEKLKKRAPAIKRFKYVSPQIWAARPGRGKTLARLFDGVLCLFEFEVPYIEKFGAKVRAIGHSGFQQARAKPGDGAHFRERHAIGAGPLLAVLPGSRRGEIAQHDERFGEIVNRLAVRMPELRIVIAAAPAIAGLIPEMIKGWAPPVTIIDADERYDAFAAADAALAVSGTVTTELAIHGTPMAVCYKMDWLTGLYVRSFVTTPYASLINIAAGRAVAPEFIQQHFKAANVADALEMLLQPGPARDAQITAFPALVGQLAGEKGPAAERAADAIIEWC